jgi:hypothetical protein
VTDHGTQAVAFHGSLDTTIKQEVEQEFLQGEPVVTKEATALLQAKPEAPDLIRCCICGSWCGPFARQNFWHGGRNYKKLKRKYHDRKRNRSRDSPLAQSRRLVS